MKATRRTHWLIFLSLLWLSTAVHASADVLFNLLRQEINYYYSHLSKDSIPVNVLTFNALDEKSVTITSDMGYSTIDEDKKRQFFPSISFNGYDKEDSFVPLNKCYLCCTDLPLNNDTTAIKDAIWSLLRTIYNKSISGKKKKNTEKDSRSHTKVDVYYESSQPNHNIDKEKWKGFLNRLSTIMKDSISATCKAILDSKIQRQYIVNSEGTAIAQNHTYYWITLYACVKDENGIDWPLYKQYSAFNESELPDENMLRQAMYNLIDRAKALSNAPMAEAYSGPVLFSREASGMLFHEILGHRLEREYSEFKPMMGKNVLPSEISVSCDPTLKYLNGIPLDGYYLYDDDGTKAQKVECIKNGIMKSLLHNKPENENNAPSNGHGRCEFGKMTMPRQSNLLVETSHPYTEEQLRELLIQNLKENNKEYGYYVHTVSNGRTTSGISNDWVSSFNVYPIETYRVYADGRPDLLVRGVSFIGTPLSTFSNIKAAGNKIGVFNGLCGARSGWIPVSAAAPMIYVSQMETQCLQEDNSQQNLILSCPEFIKKEELAGMNTDSIIFRAMADEMNRCMDSLKAEDGTRPYFMDYVIFRTTNDHLASYPGGSRYDKIDGIKYKGIISLIIGDKMRVYKTRDVKIDDLPDEESYNHIRKELWLASEALFMNQTKKRKDNRTRAQEFIADSIREWPQLPAKVNIEESALSNYKQDLEKLKIHTDTVATLLREYPELSGTRIDSHLKYTDAYRITSDGLRSRTPMKEIGLQIDANFTAPDGKIYNSGCGDWGYSADELQPIDTMKARIESMVYRLKHPKKTPFTKTMDYVGPVLFEGNPAKEELYDNIDFRTNIAHYIHSELNYEDMEYDKTYQKLGEKVINKHISVWQLGNDSVYNGIRLSKYRKFDADGISPATVELIRNGVLMNQLAGRMPTPIAKSSTGNEELKGPDYYATTEYENGVLRISFDKTMSRRRLIKKLIRLAKKQGLKYAYIKSDNGTIQINTETGEQERVNLACYTEPSRLRLLGDMWASKENTADYDDSIIHPQSILFPMVEMTLEPKYPQDCGRLADLRH